MKIVGTQHLDPEVCGFSEVQDDPVCGKPAVRHGWFFGTWETQSCGSACEEHAAALDAVADVAHDLGDKCATEECRHDR